MMANHYQKLAIRTSGTMNREEMLMNGALGLCGEGGEVAEQIKKWKFQGHELDLDKIANELGDVLWYIAIMAEAIEVDMETVMRKNIEKLQNRYPEGFDAKKSLNRQP